MKHTQRILNNEKGILTIDFIFASLLVFAFSAILFSFAFTFSVAEVVQYVTFAAARNYNQAHLNEARQRERGEQKFNQLVSDPSIAALVSAGWFRIGDLELGDFNDEYPADNGMDSANFVGARVTFSAPILYKRLPIVGATGNDPEGFTANINSYVAREPTFEECRAFMQQRIQALSGLGYTLQQNVPILMDNGC